MKAPYTRSGDYKVLYKQIKYDNRYFFIYYKGENIAKIPSCYFF